ncbi:hypothetical protein PLUTE_a6019 [Pseudoalteromonas luteoviolacea DSM 6061]|nr:hypothetical protein [Pseudoalteromonas luteoviolacea DSM 6061]
MLFAYIYDLSLKKLPPKKVKTEIVLLLKLHEE